MKLIQAVFHTPGPKWKQGVGFREQEGVMNHVEHYAKFFNAGKLKMGGPFIDNDSGGMMIATEDVTRDEIEKHAASDPAVLSGLLDFEVKTWYVAMNKDK
ncbi:MAG: hypothetical protein KDI52_06370 [Xanthomonadales bacterium]|nr:hypothetical protein [Xanthomonadales bacterium]